MVVSSSDTSSGNFSPRLLHKHMSRWGLVVPRSSACFGCLNAVCWRIRQRCGWGYPVMDSRQSTAAPLSSRLAFVGDFLHVCHQYHRRRHNRLTSYRVHRSLGWLGTAATQTVGYHLGLGRLGRTRLWKMNFGKDAGLPLSCLALRVVIDALHGMSSPTPVGLSSTTVTIWFSKILRAVPSKRSWVLVGGCTMSSSNVIES